MERPGPAGSVLSQTVDIGFDPADPAASLLETGLAASDWFVLGFEAVFLVVRAIFIFIFVFMRRRRRNAASADPKR